MIYGITTSRAHLDTIDPNLFPANPDETAGEIDWAELLLWLQEADSSTGTAAFGGRYFLGAATEAEVNAGGGFCLWAHGEASDPNTPLRIVPLQRADPVRQSAAGDDGRFYGFQDATALAEHLDRCLAVGDLEIFATKQILVFLEVGDGTPLSVDYWAAWATTVHDAILSPARLAARTGAESVQPLIPAILCAFAFDDETQTFLPEPGVRACLDLVGPPGFRTHCHGLWARRLPGDPGLLAHTFTWSNIGEYRQPRPILGIEGAYMQRVPVRYLRWFDGPEGLPIPEGPLRDTLSLLTSDWPADEGDDDPLGATFTATGWSADRREGGRLAELPSQLGIDTGARVTDAAAACLGRTRVTVSSLPYWLNPTPVDLDEPCAFAIRYYRPSGGRPLNAAESQALSQNGIQIAACFQHTADLDHGWVPYVNDLIEPFVNGEGRTDGETAFTYAADTIGQPPYTPVYFSIDFPVDTEYRQVRNGPFVRTPGLATFLDYFADVHRGYRDYLTTHPETPYYVGVYCWPDTAAALYRAGLASHFWQPPWGRRSVANPFPHLNVWQVGMFGEAQVVDDNAALEACCPPVDHEADEIWVDVDVAWGDPGGFTVR